MNKGQKDTALAIAVTMILASALAQGQTTSHDDGQRSFNSFSGEPPFFLGPTLLGAIC